MTQTVNYKEHLDKLENFKHEGHPHNSQDFQKILDNFISQFFEEFKSKKFSNMTILINSIDLFKCILKNLFEEVFQIDDYSLNLNLQLYKSIKKIMDFIIYSSESNPKFCEEICKNSHLLDLLHKTIKKFTRSGLSKHHVQILNDDIQIFCNVFNDGSREKIIIIEKMNFLESIYALLYYSYDKTKIHALLFMTNVLYNSQVKEIFTSKYIRHLDYIIKLLDKYLNDGHHESRTYSIIELGQAIENLSKSDKYNRHMVNLGLLNVLKDIIEKSSKYNENKFKRLLKSIQWRLWLNGENREDIINIFPDIHFTHDFPSNNEEQNVDEENKTKITSDNNTKKIRKRFFDISNDFDWFINNQQNNSQTENTKNTNVQNVNEIGSHVMLSYNHSNKKIVMDIYNKLKERNYNLWIDKFNINEDQNFMSSIAKGIKESIAVIIFISTKYQYSKYCRSEAQYAYQINKPIIPVRVENDLKLEDWLNLCTAGLTYINFLKYPLDEVVDMISQHIITIKPDTLITSVKNSNKSSTGICSKFLCSCTETVIEADSMKLLTTNELNLNSWTHQQVKIWFSKIGLTKINWKNLYDGHDIMLLKHFELKDFIMKCNEYFELNDLREIRILYEELQKL